MTGNEMALMASIAVDIQDKEVNEILYKIRAEILSLPTDTWNMVHRTRVLDIIDKYKGKE